ncbi:MAG: hypothetical protein GWN07_06570 [Actinobacteria bacterium]|nr:hypothetical protein [Actinomycetota bacterium]NIU65147.1 hypothetical protein [Actinomycetota bacterium]NIW26959.1 hypothetical protein [Actinomycetota bacterium]NIX19509.1 hypothetical protein [Actinomycetota bacterium]
MSAEDEGESTLVDMVTAPYRSRADDEMAIIGLLYGLGLLLIILPLLPFLVILWALGAIRDATSGN